MKRVAVVGGGVAGLATARRLAARGDVEVVVWEAAARAGGVVATSQADGYLREHAANGFLTAAGGAAELCEELGVAIEPARAAARKRWIVRRGELCAVPAELPKLVGWRALAGVLAEPFRPVRRDTGDESVAEFARRRLGREIAEAVVGPLCSGVFAGDPEQLSLRAAFPRLAELEAEGGLVRGGLTRAIRSALAGGGAGGARPRLAAPVGGMGALVDGLARAVGPRLQLGTPVVAIEADGRQRAVRLADGRREPCDAVVVAVPAPAAARLLSDASRELAQVLDEIRYAAVAAVHLGYRREDLAHPMDGFGFLVAPGEQQLRVLGCVFESVLFSGRAPAGHLLVRCILGGARDPAALELDDRALVERAHQDLDRVLGVRGTPAHRNVVRWPRAIAQYTVGHQARVARAEELADPLGVVLAGSAYHGVSINACAADAGRVAHRIAGRLGLPLALALAGTLGCSSGSKTSGAATAAGDAGGDRRTAAAAGGQPTGTGNGAIEVTVEWLSPPAALLASPGRNRCGAPLRPPLAVSALGGVVGAVVTLEGAARPEPAPDKGRPAGLAVVDCQVTPRALRLPRGEQLLVINDDERRHEVSLTRLGAEAAPVAVVPLVLVGETVAVPLERAGVVRAATAEDPAAASFVVVPEHADVVVTDDSGKVRFDGVPPGTYAVSVWHPPVGKGQPPIERRAEVAVSGGAVATSTVSLAPTR